MPTLNVTVLNKIATGDRQIIVCDNTDYTVHFELDAEWDDYNSKTMRVLYTNGNYDDIVFTGTDCDLPRIYNAQSIRIGIYAGDLHATAAAVYECKKSVLSDEGQHVDPPEDVYNQIMDAINSGVMDGVGIDNILKTATVGLVDTYTITYTNGTTTTFDITNGAQGTSITNIAKTSTSGNVDTYTITMSNGDTYTFTVTNGSVTSVDGLTGAVELDYKANIDGYYAGLTSGTTEQVLSNVKATDAELYVYRTAGGSLNIGDREEKTIVGATVVWNQLVQNGDFSDGTTGWTLGSGSTASAADNVCTVTAGNANPMMRTNVNYVANHKFLVTLEVYPVDYDTTETRLNFHSGSASISSSRFFGLTKNTWHRLSKIFSADADYSPMQVRIYFDYNSSASGREYKIQNVNVIDLTPTSSAIADRAYTLEQTTVGSGVAWLQSYGFFTKPYYAYTASPSLQSVKTSAHETVGFNQWDEVWELGGIDASGNKDSTTNKIRSKNYINAVPNTTYYCYGGGSGNIIVRYYDGNKGFIGDSGQTKNATFTTPTNCCYMLFACTTGYGTTYNNNICISLYWDGERAGEYEAYNKHEYPLDSSISLNGILKLDSNNEIYADGDTYEADGTVARYYEKRAYASGDESLTDAITDGTNTVVKLATPTTETADPFQSPMIVDDWGTERFVDAEYEAGNRDFEMPVGHVTKYPINIRAKVETAPDSPSGDGDYIVRQTNGQNVYVPLEIPNELPTAPTTDGTYSLKVTVSDGVATYSWEA